jgi:hypothetical protein
VTTATKIDETKLHARIMANFQAVLGELYGYTGKPTWNITSLNPSAAPKRLNEFKIGNGAGAWMSLTTGASGPDVYSFVEWFGACDHEAAVEMLDRVVGTIERSKA